MKHFIRLSDYTVEDVYEIFRIVDALKEGKYRDFLKGKTIILFFSFSSIRTRVSFEKGVFLLGGQTILFPPETLDKKEKIEDVIGYLNNWTDLVVVRHSTIELIDEMAKYATFPVINGMTSINHPCEVLGDLYALSKTRENWRKDKFLFVGPKGNIGMAWKEAANLMGFSLVQSCPVGYEIEGVEVVRKLQDAIANRDVICTDSLNKEVLKDFANHQITLELMELAGNGALLNPCPPFYRGEEVSEDVINSKFFVGYEFKKHLLEVQQAIMIYSILHK